MQGLVKTSLENAIRPNPEKTKTVLVLSAKSQIRKISNTQTASYFQFFIVGFQVGRLIDMGRVSETYIVDEKQERCGTVP